MATNITQSIEKLSKQGFESEFLRIIIKFLEGRVLIQEIHKGEIYPTTDSIFIFLHIK